MLLGMDNPILISNKTYTYAKHIAQIVFSICSIDMTSRQTTLVSAIYCILFFSTPSPAHAASPSP
uniref:Uncharacterized protein n=1 Tax=Candidatus Kentrum sp. TC TaxID=2126339 RepID=A0A450ZCL2_9GAMM|nr:MAG: hypothetical protein BECKTC1821E_GA0114239_10717 [Candidatus Kentron sp. TC]VFK51388.1 MAG: hypothetical protein BECKTC1821D_GA0114238_11342 [Candidatus Kentron sp. TC]VFK62206.1 MAG: hypothetical protein BECKTC1821F_GA0114240_10716 [Candidatus Kentron sp. TC]